MFFISVADMQSITGEDFMHAVQRLGIENFSNVSGNSFAWMFDYELLWPFLDWFCAELQTTNVLKLSELEQ